MKLDDVDSLRLLAVYDGRHPIMEYNQLMAAYHYKSASGGDGGGRGRSAFPPPSSATSGASHRPIRANTVELSSADRLRLIYGANMSGKSTLLQQTGLIVVLAHIGMYVPSSFACLTPVDKIFARMGASESLVHNRSHFLSEMFELSHVLNSATPRSLVLCDEVWFTIKRNEAPTNT